MAGLPFQQTVTRREPNAADAFYPKNANVRVPMDIYPHEAPDPIRDSEFWQEGKPFEHAWAHTVRFVSTSIPGILSVDAWVAEGGRVAKYIRSNIIRTPLGVQHAFVERLNIDQTPSTPYGSLHALADTSSLNIFDVRAMPRYRR